jgi:hypothetical protein
MESSPQQQQEDQPNNSTNTQHPTNTNRRPNQLPIAIAWLQTVDRS